MTQMRRMLLLAVAAALLVAGSAAPASAAKPTTPTIFAKVDYCEQYGASFNVVGLEPNTEYLFLYLSPGGGGHWFTTDGAGAYLGVGGASWDRPFEIGVRMALDPNHNGFIDANERVVLEQHFRFVRPCELPVPTGKADCQKSGWRSFGRFKNRGKCIRFVNRGSGN